MRVTYVMQCKRNAACSNAMSSHTMLAHQEQHPPTQTHHQCHPPSRRTPHPATSPSSAQIIRMPSICHPLKLTKLTLRAPDHRTPHEGPAVLSPGGMSLSRTEGHPSSADAFTSVTHVPRALFRSHTTTCTEAKHTAIHRSNKHAAQRDTHARLTSASAPCTFHPKSRMSVRPSWLVATTRR